MRALASNFSYGHTKIPSRTLSLSLLFNIISPNRFLLPCPTPTLFLSESVVLSVSPCAKPSQNGGGVNCQLVNCGQPSDTEAYLKSILLVSAPCTLPSSQPADGTFLLHCTPRPANISTTPNKSNRNRQDVCSLHFRNSGSSSTNPDSLSTVWILSLFFPSIPYEVPPPGPTKTRGTTPLQTISLHPKKNCPEPTRGNQVRH